MAKTETKEKKGRKRRRLKVGGGTDAKSVGAIGLKPHAPATFILVPVYGLHLVSDGFSSVSTRTFQLGTYNGLPR